jgi:3'-5' exoribonuclease
MSIRDLTAGERVEGFFALRKIDRREFQGGEFLALEIGDSSGRIDAVMWDGVAGVVEQLAVGQIVKVRGVVGTYRDRPQIRIDKIRPAQDGEVDPSEFVARSPVDPQQLSDELDRRVTGLTNPHLRALLASLLGTEPLRSQFLAAPAGKLWHHDVIGGLAEHSLNIARICEFACSLYPDLDRDLLITGALLHDLGKIEQYTVGAMIDYSDEGRLVGHINSGDFRITTAIRALPGFPDELERVLRHLIISHQGLLENGSPVVPQTPEAFVLYCADELDSKMGALRHVAAKTGERDWSDFVRLIERHIYFGHRRARAESDEE